MPGVGAAEPGDRGVGGEVLEESEVDLGAAGVVYAQEQHDRSAVIAFAIDLGQGGQPLAGEAFGQQE